MRQNIFRPCLLLALFFFALGKMNGYSQTKTIPEAARQVYGNAITSFSEAQINWLKDQLDRSKVQKKERAAGESIPLLSGVTLMTKFEPALQRDDFSHPQSINPLKYNIDFFKTEDQSFRIDGTDYILFIAGKK